MGGEWNGCSNLASSGEPPASHDHFNHLIDRTEVCSYSAITLRYSFYLREGGYVFALSVYLFVGRIMQKTTKPIFAKFGGKVARGPRKKRLDFGGNPDPGIF